MLHKMYIVLCALFIFMGSPVHGQFTSEDRAGDYDAYSEGGTGEFDAYSEEQTTAEENDICGKGREATPECLHLMKKKAEFSEITFNELCGRGRETTPECVKLMKKRAEFSEHTFDEICRTGKEKTPECLKLMKKRVRFSETAFNEICRSGKKMSAACERLVKKKAGFKGLTPDDIIRGNKLLEEKEERESDSETEEAEEEPREEKEIEVGSLFDRYRETGPYQDISTELRPFGYEFFSQADLKLLPARGDMPVMSDYIIGPGDEVKILLWGRVNAQYSLIVDRDGNITIPKMGAHQVAGMRFDEMRQYLAEQVNQIVGASMNVTMGMLKSIRVFVLGDVRRPGSYAVDPYSTITTALIEAGGPTEIGSLREIQLKRNGSDAVVMDFYDFLLKGDKSQDRGLQAGDVIFVQTVGPLVGMAGNVRRPAIYELRNEHDLLSLFNMAGGIIPSAYTQQIQVERIQENERQIVVDLDDSDLTGSRDFLLQDGDLVKVFSIVDDNANIVFLNGNVKRPGMYEYKPGMRVMDLVKGTDDLLPDTHFAYALIKRMPPHAVEEELVPFNLGGLLFENDASNNVELQPRDKVHIFSKWLFRDKPYVTVEGEVREKGSFRIFNNYRVKDAVLDAGGLTRDASLHTGEVFRRNGHGDISQIYFNVRLAMAEDPEQNLTLQDRDRIVIHSVLENNYERTVSIDGEVKNPGVYPLVQGMRMSDLIFSAGNVLESAFMNEAEISSQVVEKGRSTRIEHREVNLEKVLSRDPVHNLELHPYDRVFVKQIPDWRHEDFVMISGEVPFNGKYVVRKGEKLSSLIERAGGYTENAYLRGAVFTREYVRELQQKSLDEMAVRLESRLLVEGSGKISTALSQEEISSKKAEMEQKQKFIESLKNVKATGRMTVRLAHLRLLKGSEYDIELEEGDTLHIPVRNNVVNVVGSVMSRSSFIYTDGMGYKDYIKMAGGYTSYADTDNVYVLKVDGSARKLAGGFFNWNMITSRWEMSPFMKDAREIEPGDTIVVPEKLDHIAWLREIKDITQILMQTAVAAGVVLNLL